MAQTGYTPISIYYSSTATNVPTAGNLVAGELAINTADGKLFYKDSSGVVQTIATKGAGTVAGSTGYVQYNNAGALGASSSFYWDITNSRLGIGTTSPAQKLQVNGISRFYTGAVSTVGAVASSALLIDGAGTNGNISQIGFGYDATATYMPAAIYGITTSQSGNTAQDIAFATRSVTTDTAPTERMRIASDGNVGIGTASPTTKLDVVSAGGTFARIYNSASQADTYLKVQNGLGSGWQGIGSTGYYMYTPDSIPLQFFTANSERMRIDSSGNFYVGKSTYSDTSGNGFGVFPNSGIPQVSCVGAANSTQKNFTVYSSTDSGYKFFVTYAGVVNAVTTTISGISDQRLKENIVDLDVGLNAVMALKPRKFDWKKGKGANTKNARGFIAQEFETVFPDLIDEWADPAPKGELPYKSVRADLIPVLVKAIQEQQAMIETLTTRLNALEGK